MQLSPVCPLRYIQRWARKLECTTTYSMLHDVRFAPPPSGLHMRTSVLESQCIHTELKKSIFIKSKLQPRKLRLAISLHAPLNFLASPATVRQNVIGAPTTHDQTREPSNKQHSALLLYGIRTSSTRESVAPDASGSTKSHQAFSLACFTS